MMGEKGGPASLDDRIPQAFLSDAKSGAVASLIGEVDIAAAAANEAAQHARQGALDPKLTSADVAAARREMEDASFRCERLQAAVIKLKERLEELKAAEEDRRRWAAYEKAKAERDKLAVELKETYPTVAVHLADLATRIESNDRDIHLINTRARPNRAEPLLGAEAVARGIRNYIHGTGNIPRITEKLQLPAFEYEPLQRYTWPRHE